MNLSTHSYTMSILEEVAEFLEGQSDVVDGSYGEPSPNRAMSLQTRVEQAIERLKSAAPQELKTVTGDCEGRNDPKGVSATDGEAPAVAAPSGPNCVSVPRERLAFLAREMRMRGNRLANADILPRDFVDNNAEELEALAALTATGRTD